MVRPLIGKLAALRDASTLGVWNHMQTAPVLGLVALELDQLSKLVVRETLLPGEAIPHGARLRITNVVNPGILFGAPASPLVSLLLPLAMMLAALGIYWRFHRSNSPLLNIGTGLFVGGTLGNLLDRIIHGHVTDFVEVVTFGGYVRTIFNLADLCIISGIILLEVFLIRHIIRAIREKGLNYNPAKPAVARFIQRKLAAAVELHRAVFLGVPIPDPLFLGIGAAVWVAAVAGGVFFFNRAQGSWTRSSMGTTAPALAVEGLSKEYRLGVRGRETLTEATALWWGRLRGRPAAPAGAAPAPPKPRRLAAQMDPARPGWFRALRDVSFEVPPGEVLGVIGANGAGKSTLLKVLARVTAPTRGKARLRGRVASLLEVGTGFHPELTGRENVFVNGAILGMREAEIRGKFDAIVDFADIADFIDTPVKRYSSGMRTRLAFAVAAHLEADLLLLDEVLSVGDASFQKKCLGKMEDLAGHGRTVLLVRHRFGSITELCSRVIWMDGGRVRLDGPTDPVVEAYLASIAEASGARAWDRGISPQGDGRIALHGLRLLNHRGEAVSAVDAGHDFEVELEYALRAPLA